MSPIPVCVRCGYLKSRHHVELLRMGGGDLSDRDIR
jgi:hypothetical protein